MKNLAVFVPTILVVTAALAGLALRAQRRARERGRSGAKWLAALLGTWLGVLALAAFGARFAYERHDHSAPSYWAVFVPAVVLAFGAALALGWRLSRLPALGTTEPAPPAAAPMLSPPIPPRPFTPLPAPPLVHSFKFGCPHCGQHLAVTTADIGTTANCPNCEELIEVPEPSSTGSV